MSEKTNRNDVLKNIPKVLEDPPHINIKAKIQNALAKAKKK